MCYTPAWELAYANLCQHDRCCVLQNVYCGAGGVKAITSMEVFEDIMRWCEQHYSGKGITRGHEYWERFRYTMTLLARDHGFVGEEFDYHQSLTVSIDIKGQAVAHQNAAIEHKPDTVRQEAKAFCPEELTDFTQILSQSTCSSDMVSLFMYNGLAIQSTTRPGQICSVTRGNVRMYPEGTEMLVPAHFGPLTMLGVSDRGHLKQDCQAEVSHWICRSRQASVTDPVFAMAMKAALDNQRTHAEHTGDLLQSMQQNKKGRT